MKTVVIKIGSNIITLEEGINERRLTSIARDVSTLHDRGFHPVIVSSGAIAAGKNKLNLHGRIHDIKMKQALAAVGQSSLMWAYERIFDSFNKKVAQILLTRDIFSDRRRYLNSKDTLMTLLAYNIIPVINENDTVAVDEIKFGDNDHLAALVALLLDANELLILSDVDGLYTGDPRKNRGAQIIPYVEEITPEIVNLAQGVGSIHSTGGMYSKIIAAKKATDNGIKVTILSGKQEGALVSFLHGEKIGTSFKPQKKKFGARKGWIALSIRAKGSLVIDDGAVEAIVKKGKSLLPSGILSLEGDFERGDGVYCIDESGTKVAKGLVNYAASELLKILGKRTSQIEHMLGYKYSDEVIHRDNMTII